MSLVKQNSPNVLGRENAVGLEQKNILNLRARQMCSFSTGGGGVICKKHLKSVYVCMSLFFSPTIHHQTKHKIQAQLSFLSQVQITEERESNINCTCWVPKTKLVDFSSVSNDVHFIWCSHTRTLSSSGTYSVYGS